MIKTRMTAIQARAIAAMLEQRREAPSAENFNELYDALGGGERAIGLLGNLSLLMVMEVEPDPEFPDLIPD